MSDPNDSPSDDERATTEQYDWDSVTPSTALVEAVVTAFGRYPAEIEPRYYAIARRRRAFFSKTCDETSLTVYYEGLRATVDENGYVS